MAFESYELVDESGLSPTPTMRIPNRSPDSKCAIQMLESIFRPSKKHAPRDQHVKGGMWTQFDDLLVKIGGETAFAIAQIEKFEKNTAK